MKRLREPAWPITFLLVGYPLWWALGVADFMWILLAIPMASRMLQWRSQGTRRLRVPPGFWLWLLFLACAVIGIATLSLTAPGTAPSPVSHRVFAYIDRTLSYIGITVLLLYAGNLTERELPRRRLAWMLGLVAIYATVGGVAAMIKPTLQFSSPMELILPHSLRSNYDIHAIVHPGLAQMQNVLGGANARPKAPFDFTNTWGNCITLLLPWLVAGWWPSGSRRQRLVAGFFLVLAIVPLLYSLNRGAWLGAGLSLVYVFIRLVARRPQMLVGTICLAAAVAGIVAFATPVPSLIAQRLSHGKSNNLRAGLDTLAVQDALSSPVVGYGDTRKQMGSQNTIARGPSAKCAICGQQNVGSTGQLWLLLVCNGVVGTVLYIGFFVLGIRRFRRDRTPYGYAGMLALLLSLLYLISYDALSAPLGFTMLSYAMLWRNDMALGMRRARPHPEGRVRLPKQTLTRRPAPTTKVAV